MTPGSLRHRVDIVSSAVSSPDGLGGGTRTPTTVATVWACVEPARGQERRVAEALRGQVTHLVTIRYPHTFTVTPSMRVVWTPVGGQAHTLVVKAIVMPEAVTRWLELHCVEGE